MKSAQLCQAAFLNALLILRALFPKAIKVMLVETSGGDCAAAGGHEPGGFGQSAPTFPGEHGLDLPEKDSRGTTGEAKSRDAAVVLCDTFQSA